MSRIKEIIIKARTNYFFDDMVNIKDLHSNNIKTKGSTTQKDLLNEVIER